MKRNTFYGLFTIMLTLAFVFSACAPQASPEPTMAATMEPTMAPAPANPEMILATTTSTRDSGLLDGIIATVFRRTDRLQSENGGCGDRCSAGDG